jgi:CTP synthase (UTP-ammonia lyase)
MSSPRLSVRISPPLLDRLESFVDQHNFTVSEGVIAVIAYYIGDAEGMPLVERVRQVEKRLAQLEGKN